MENNRKTVLVTGASSGMGKEFALILRKRGMILYLRRAAQESWKLQLPRSGRNTDQR